MSDSSQGPGWWIASDGKWYPPESATPPPPAPPAPPAAPVPPTPSAPPSPTAAPIPPAPAYPSAPAAPGAGGSTPTEAVLSLVLGIIGILACGCWGLGIILGGVGLFLGSTAKKKIAASGGALGGASIAQAGFICSIVALVLSLLGLLLLIISIATGNGSFYFSTNS